MYEHVCGMTLNDEHWCPELKKHAFVRIHNGGGRGRIVSGPCFMVQSDQGGAPQIVDEQDLTAVRSTSSATDEAMQGKGRHGDRLDFKNWPGLVSEADPPGTSSMSDHGPNFNPPRSETVSPRTGPVGTLDLAEIRDRMKAHGQLSVATSDGVIEVKVTVTKRDSAEGRATARGCGCVCRECLRADGATHQVCIHRCGLARRAAVPASGDAQGVSLTNRQIAERLGDMVKGAEAWLPRHENALVRMLEEQRSEAAKPAGCDCWGTSTCALCEETPEGRARDWERQCRVAWSERDDARRAYKAAREGQPRTAEDSHALRDLCDNLEERAEKAEGAVDAARELIAYLDANKLADDLTPSHWRHVAALRGYIAAVDRAKPRRERDQKTCGSSESSATQTAAGASSATTSGASPNAGLDCGRYGDAPGVPCRHCGVRYVGAFCENEACPVMGKASMTAPVHTCPAGSVSLHHDCVACQVAFRASGSKRDYPWKTPDGNVARIDDRGPRQATPSSGDPCCGSINISDRGPDSKCLLYNGHPKEIGHYDPITLSWWSA